MGATITKLANKAKYLVGSLKECPLESALCITFFLIWVFRVSIGNALKGAGLNVNVEQFFVWFVPQFVLCYSLHQLKDRNRMLAILYYLSWFVWIPLLLLCSSPNEWSIAISYMYNGMCAITRHTHDGLVIRRREVVACIQQNTGVGLCICYHAH